MIPATAVYAPEQPVPQLPPPEKFNVPLLLITLPVLLNTTLIVLLIPPVIWNVPALLNVLAVPPLKKIPFPLPFAMVQVAPERLLITAPFRRDRMLPPVALPNVVVPGAFSVRVSRITLALGRLIPPLALVTPVPLIVPPVHANCVVKLMIPVFVIVPALKFVVAEEIVSVPEPKSIVAPLKFTVPVPLIGPLCTNVPPENAIVPAPAVYVPEQPVPQLPPPEKFNVPLLPITLPVLLNATLTVLDTPPVICNVPALLNAAVAPPLKRMPVVKTLLPFTMFQVAPDRLFTTAPFVRNRMLPPVAFPNVVVPGAFSVRVSRNTVALGMLIPPLALVAPVPFIVPPVQVSNPVRATVPVPDRAPPLRFVAPCTVLAPLSVNVPPLMFKAFANVAAPLTVSGPEVKLIVEFATKLAMVWLAAVPREPMVMVELEKPVPMHTLSVAIGTVPLLQLLGVAHWLSPAAPVH